MSTERKAKSSIAKKLRELRVGNGLSQSQVAKELGIAQQTYSKYENLDKSVPIDSGIIKKLCEMYGISADYLLDIENDNNVMQPRKTAALLDDENNVNLIVTKVLSQLEKTDKEK